MIEHGKKKASPLMMLTRSRIRSSLDGGPIRFYERGQPYFEFTNFAEFPIQLDGKTWPTSEHYFQAQKFVGTPYEETIRNLPRAREAFDLSRQPQVSQWLRNDWEKVKLDVMHKALLAKFSQHSDLRDMLMKTGSRQLIEHTSRDSYWGDGGDGRGHNHLGQLLMKIRAELLPHDYKRNSLISLDTKPKKLSTSTDSIYMPPDSTVFHSPEPVPYHHSAPASTITFESHNCPGREPRRSKHDHLRETGGRSKHDHLREPGGRTKHDHRGQAIALCFVVSLLLFMFISTYFVNMPSVHDEDRTDKG